MRKKEPRRNLEFFNTRLTQWKDKLRDAVISVGVKPNVAARIPVVTAGYEADQTLPGCDNWLSNLWITSIEQMKERSQPALLVANKDRIKRPDQTKPEDFKKPLHEQPIIYTPVKYGTAPLVTTAIGFLVGAAVAGPVGAAAGGAAGASAGGVVNALIALFSWQSQKTASSASSPPSSQAENEPNEKGT